MLRRGATDESFLTKNRQRRARLRASEVGLVESTVTDLSSEADMPQ